MAMVGHKNLYQFLDIFIKEIMNTTLADSVIIYRLDRKEKVLRFEMATSRTLEISHNLNSVPHDWKVIRLYDKHKHKNLNDIASICVFKKMPIIIDDFEHATKTKQRIIKSFDFKHSYKTYSAICVPLFDHKDKIMGVLQLSNKKLKDGTQARPFSLKDKKIIQAVSSQIAVLFSNAHLIEELENMFESFLEAMVFAMKEESEHTYRHMHKMSKLSDMFVDAIDKDNSLFHHKKFNNDEKRAMKYAALLHDIGKLTTPANILNKGSKLQNVFDRIELVKLRFDYAKKCAKIDMLKAICENPDKTQYFKQQYEENIRQIDDDFGFLEYVNKVGMISQADIKRVVKISKKTFHDDGKTISFLTHEEAKNLKIKKGSLTKQERGIINNHVNVTIKILEQLKLPKKYEKIPEISGNHHEKLNGTGYPNGLTADKISFEARILSISDVFEALTSTDRPYKKPKSVSKALKVLFNMAAHGELDKSLVKFFYTSKVYLKYAQKYLTKEQIDNVTFDVDSFF